MKKTMVSMILVFAVVVSMCSLMASAAVVDPGIVEPMFEDCEMCAGGRVNREETVYNEWRTQDWGDCKVDTRYKDEFQRRTYYIVYACDNCNYSYEDHSAETRWLCVHGENR